MMIIFGLIRVLATTLFLYLVWRRLKEDYNEDDLLAYSWLFLLAFLVSGRVAFGLVNWGVWNDSWVDWLSVWSKPGFNYLGGYVGGLLLSWVYIQKKEWKVWNFAEDMTPIALIYYIFLMIGEVVFARFGMDVLLWLAVLVLVLVVSSVVKDKYRSMVWYSSGKKGFVFFFANMVFGLLGTGVSVWMGNTILLRVVMVGWSLISMVGLFMLGEVMSHLKVNRR